MEKKSVLMACYLKQLKERAKIDHSISDSFMSAVNNVFTRFLLQCQRSNYAKIDLFYLLFPYHSHVVSI